MSVRRSRSSLVWIVVILFSVLILFAGGLVWLMSGSEGQSAVDSLQNMAEQLFGRDFSGGASKTDDEKPVDMEITAGVTHSIEGEYRNILITSSGTVLKNKVVTGDITIADTVSDGTVTLENVIVRGKVIVNGGAQIKLFGVTAIEIVSQYKNGSTKYSVGGKSFIHQLTAGNSVIIDESELKNGYTGIKSVAAPEGKKLRRVVLKSGSIEQTPYDDNESSEKSAS